MQLTDDELNRLRAATSEREWNAICNDVKSKRNGKYPDDWYEKVLASGLIYEVKCVSGFSFF